MDTDCAKMDGLVSLICKGADLGRRRRKCSSDNSDLPTRGHLLAQLSPSYTSPASKDSLDMSSIRKMLRRRDWGNDGRVEEKRTYREELRARAIQSFCPLPRSVRHGLQGGRPWRRDPSHL